MRLNTLQPVGTGVRRESVCIGTRALPGVLELPDHPQGIVVFANEMVGSHGSTQNARRVRVWRAFGLGVLLFDLLTEQEALDRRGVRGIPLLAARLVDALAWLGRRDELQRVPIGLFGVGVGAAAALLAAASQAESVGAVVASDGRTDFVTPYLPRVRAPTLLLVGSDNEPTLGSINRLAMSVLTCDKRLETLPRAASAGVNETDLPDICVSVAGRWFEQHLSRMQH